MKDTLVQGEELLISGFGKFSVRQKNVRLGRNPQTKESLILAARKVLGYYETASTRVLRQQQIFQSMGNSGRRPLLILIFKPNLQFFQAQ